MTSDSLSGDLHEVGLKSRYSSARCGCCRERVSKSQRDFRQPLDSSTMLCTLTKEYYRKGFFFLEVIILRLYLTRWRSHFLDIAVCVTKCTGTHLIDGTLPCDCICA